MIGALSLATADRLLRFRMRSGSRRRRWTIRCELADLAATAATATHPLAGLPDFLLSRPHNADWTRRMPSP